MQISSMNARRAQTFESQSIWDRPVREPLEYLKAFRADPIDRIVLVKRGISRHLLGQLAKDMSIPKGQLRRTLGIKCSDRRASALSRSEGSRVFGVARLIGHIQTIIDESGNPAEFDAADWVGRWLFRPLPALGGMKPAELMDTSEGQALVESIVARMQSGAYC